jgi:hypothetical protein
MRRTQMTFRSRTTLIKKMIQILKKDERKSENLRTLLERIPNNIVRIINVHSRTSKGEEDASLGSERWFPRPG